ncbi:His Kinase A (phospho-acceptor) domain-containing protein [Ekhidna lutea]|uniref:histidine kinase n=1 Tax=Ekhidna lutea TaxID=447679 RepID=A0A239MCW3_EKHLU|nr:HAMP domain-containing sensor histidine kinase [Ekhidna lutea]SNT39983.1 His Kinase A (phospho-acceptor) domain-containing protein [Ekhidna lutea]
MIAALVDFFIHPDYFEDPLKLRKARLFVRSCLLTSLFSNSYIWFSMLYEYDRGVNLMIFNVIGFLALAFLVKTRLPLLLITNTYILVGSIAVLVLTYFSGGIWSAVYPWIISIPVLALLVVNRTYGIAWGIFAFLAMLWFGWLELQGIKLPYEYNQDLKAEWFISVLPGLLLIILIISAVFESVQTGALRVLQKRNEQLAEQKETIADQSRKLERLIDDKDHLIRILAHDLKNPLANITTIANILKEEEDVDEQKKFISMIEKVSGQAQGLVNKVLDMAINEQGGIKLKIEQLNINQVVVEAIDSMLEIAKKKKIEIQYQAKDELVLVNADKTYLLLIFENLLSNAIKFSSPGYDVHVDVTLMNSTVSVRVMDEGQGIRPEEEDLLFERFAKLSSKPTAEESSTGLGLSLVKEYVDQINGKVWYDNQASKGATFVVELPVVN